MPTATSFLFPRSFPYCPTTATRSLPYVDNISLTAAMSIYWNAYNFDLTLSGTATSGTYTADIGGVYSANPAAFTGTAFNAQSAIESMWVGTGYGSTNFGSVPTYRTPRDRICVPVTIGNAEKLLEITLSGTTFDYESGTMTLYLRGDPNNSDKFRLYYDFEFVVEKVPEAPPDAVVVLSSENTYTGATVVVTSTFDFFGLSLTYYGLYEGSSYSNISMSCTGQLYTY